MRCRRLRARERYHVCVERNVIKQLIANRNKIIQYNSKNFMKALLNTTQRPYPFSQNIHWSVCSTNYIITLTWNYCIQTTNSRLEKPIEYGSSVCLLVIFYKGTFTNYVTSFMEEGVSLTILREGGRGCLKHFRNV